MKYLIMMHVNPEVMAALTLEQQRMLGTGHQAFVEKTTETGEMLSTHAFADPSQTKVVRSRNGKPETIDGPFAETKEFMGGYYLIDVESEERALELANEIPDARIDGLALEIRPVMYSAGADL